MEEEPLGYACMQPLSFTLHSAKCHQLYLSQTLPNSGTLLATYYLLRKALTSYVRAVNLTHISELAGEYFARTHQSRGYLN